MTRVSTAAHGESGSFHSQTRNVSTVDWPKTDRYLRPTARIRTQPEDFRVVESLALEPCGSGEHLFVYVRKKDLATQEVAKQLANHFGVQTSAIGFAGLKDKRSIADQWFSIQLPKTDAVPALPNIDVLQVTRHNKKLRRTDMGQNTFEIVVRQLEPLLAELPKHLCVPNYFGEQRFGRGGRNLGAAQRWVASGKPRVTSFQRSIHISTMRSHVFNCVLAERVRTSTWNTPLDGDVLNLGLPTGPLWGRGHSATSGKAREVEQHALSGNLPVCEALEWMGLTQQRRPLSLAVEELHWSVEASYLRISFALPAGAYATTVLRELFNYRTVS